MTGFARLLQSLTAGRVEFISIGGFAVTHHAIARPRGFRLPAFAKATVDKQAEGICSRVAAPEV
jgi:hypothetical protein